MASKDTTAVMLIRRELVTWLRPVEALEQLVVTGGVGITTDIFSPISANPGLASDVLHLLVGASMVGRLRPRTTLTTFSDSVSRLQSPDLVSKSMAQEVLADQDRPTAMGEVMGRIGLVQAMECLLYCLELDRGSASSGKLNISDVEREGVCKVFSSSVVAQSLTQQVETRLWLAQQLLVTQHLFLGCGNSAGLAPTTLDMIQSTFLPRTTVMVHCYSVLHWLCTTPATPTMHSATQQSLRQMAVLRLGETSTASIPVKENTSNSSILEMFLTGPGTMVRAVVWRCLAAGTPTPDRDDSTATLRCAVPTFLHFLLTSCQHSVILQATLHLV